MAANFCSKLSGRGITLWILCLAAVFAFAVNVSAQQTFSSGSNGSDGAFDLTGTTPGTIVKLDPTQFHGSGVQNNVFNFTTITIPAGVTVKLSGDRINGPVYWLARGNVDIEGIVDLNGQDGPPAVAILAGRTRALPGAGGFAGGVGGKYDALPIPPGEPGAQPGDGPLGGTVEFFPDRPSCSRGFGGNFSGNPFLVPLVGGSGGGGANVQGAVLSVPYGPGGGAGGGAILIASSSSITVNGTISANGGSAASSVITGCDQISGPGAGGGIRLAAPTISGNGTLTALAGTAQSERGGNGVIRLEAFTDNFNGRFNGTPESMGSPFSTFIPANGPPSVTVINVNGINVTQPPTGSLVTPDATIDTGSAVQITIQARFIPSGTVLTLKVFSDNDTDQIVQTTPLLGTLQSSTATATVTFPSGFSLNYVKATWTQ